MRKFTIVFSVLLVLCFTGVLAYVAGSPEFVPPQTLVTAKDEDPEAPVWDETPDDLLAYLEGEGLIDLSAKGPLTNEGLCSEAYIVNGAEFYYWDLDALDEDSGEYQAYVSLKSEGVIDLYGSGYVISPVSNGPFGLLATRYSGDADALVDAFESFGQE